MKRTALVVLLLLGSWTGVAAAELLMVEQPGCSWCRRWHDEIGPGYAKTAEGKVAPLRRADLRALPPDISFKAAVTATPTFVLVHDGMEIGRLTGYPGAEFFYGMLAPLLGKLPGTRAGEVAKE